MLVLSLMSLSVMGQTGFYDGTSVQTSTTSNLTITGDVGIGGAPVGGQNLTVDGNTMLDISSSSTQFFKIRSLNYDGSSLNGYPGGSDENYMFNIKDRYVGIGSEAPGGYLGFLYRMNHPFTVGLSSFVSSNLQNPGFVVTADNYYDSYKGIFGVIPVSDTKSEVCVGCYGSGSSNYYDEDPDYRVDLRVRGTTTTNGFSMYDGGNYVSGGTDVTGYVLTSSDQYGNAEWAPISGATGATGATGPTGPTGATGTNNLNCTTNNIVPVYNTSSGLLECSQIYDDGTQVGIGTTTPQGSYLLTIDAGSSTNDGVYINGTVLSTGTGTFSDARLKDNVNDIDNALEKILSVSGKYYDFKQNIEGMNLPKTHQIGFLAQELKEVFPEAVQEMHNGYFAVNYNAITPVLVEAIKEQQTIIEDQNETIAGLSNKVDDLNQRLAALEVLLLGGNNQPSDVKTDLPTEHVKPSNNSSMLYQNVPNPFNGTTTIAYTLAEGQKGSIQITDIQGRLIDTVELTNAGTGKIELNMSEFGQGNYFYSLVINGKVTDTKKMVKQ